MGSEMCIRDSNQRIYGRVRSLKSGVEVSLQYGSMPVREKISLDLFDNPWVLASQVPPIKAAPAAVEPAEQQADQMSVLEKIRQGIDPKMPEKDDLDFDDPNLFLERGEVVFYAHYYDVYGLFTGNTITAREYYDLPGSAEFPYVHLVHADRMAKINIGDVRENERLYEILWFANEDGSYVDIEYIASSPQDFIRKQFPEEAEELIKRLTDSGIIEETSQASAGERIGGPPRPITEDTSLEDVYVSEKGQLDVAYSEDGEMRFQARIAVRWERDKTTSENVVPAPAADHGAVPAPD